MNNVEIYISDQLVDLTENTEIERTYTSPLFGDLESIANAVTNNITLPITPRNRAIFGFAERLDVEVVETPFVRLPAKMYINGTPVFDNGYAQLTEVSESGYSVVLTWGAIDGFERLIESKLTDLGPALMGLGYESIAWNEKTPKRITALTGVDFLTVNYGMGINDRQYLRPSVSVDLVLQAIEEAHGITISGRKDLATTSDGQPLYLPLVERNGDSETPAVLLFGPSRVSGGFINSTNRVADFAGINDDGIVIDVSEVDFVRIKITGIEGNNQWDKQWLARYIIKQYGDAPKRDRTFAILGGQKYSTNINDYVALYTMYSVASQDVDSSHYDVYFNNIDYQVDARDYKIIRFAELTYRVDSTDGQGDNPDVFWNVTINGDFKDKKVIYPWNRYPIAPNLPDMSQGEFLQSLMMMKGLFPYTDAQYPNAIRTMSVADLYRIMTTPAILSGGPYDWSNKLQAPARMSNMADADAVAFEVGDYAQRNILDYENDDDVTYNTEGIIDCDSVFLDKEKKDNVQFSASMNAVSDDTNGITALIPIYEQSDDGKEVNENSVSSRIIAAVQVTETKADGTTRDIYVGQFLQSQFFGGKSGIVATYYKELQQIVKRPRVITVELHLTNVDLWYLVYYKPVYFDRFGCYFAIEQLIVDGNNMVTAKMVALPALQAAAENTVAEQQVNE